MANNHKKLIKEVKANKNFEFLENGKVRKFLYFQIIQFRFIVK